MRFGTTCIAAAMLAGSPAIAGRPVRTGSRAGCPTNVIQQGGIGLCNRQDGQRVLDLYGAILLSGPHGQQWGLCQAPDRCRQTFANRGLRCARGNRLRRCQRFSSCDLVHRDHKWRDSVLRHTPRGVMRADESAVTAETCPCQHRRFCQLLAFFELALTARSTNGVAI